MVTVYLFGGIGNQLFQLSKGYEIAKSKNLPLNCKFLEANYIYSNKRKLEVNKLVGKEFNFQIIPSYFAYFIYLWLKYFVSNFRFLSILFGINHEMSTRDKRLLLYGYFQDDKPSAEFLCEIQKSIELKIRNKKYSEQFYYYYNKIIQSNSVSVHLRRGDFLLGKNRKIYETLGESYYSESIEYFPANHSLFVFSDNILDSDLKYLEKFSYTKISGINDIEEFILMSLCEHHIIANSTFSYWASVIHRTRKTIIIIPKNWQTGYSLFKNDENIIKV